MYHLVSLFCSESVGSSSLKVQAPVSVALVLLSVSLLVRLTVVAFGAVFCIVSWLLFTKLLQSVPSFTLTLNVQLFPLVVFRVLLVV